jgi:uncharacterized membrane protein (UPF0127 family)
MLKVVRRSRFLVLSLALGAVALTPCARSALVPRAHAQAAAQQVGLESLEIATKSGVQRLSVEVMRTEAEREKGLMFRRFMPADRGMLFDFKSEQSVMMWMKNTYIPLDMVFIRRDGTVSHVAENAEPLSERIIPSDGPAYAVLEVNAGLARQLGIAPGDKVRHSLFNR